MKKNYIQELRDLLQTIDSKEFHSFISSAGSKILRALKTNKKVLVAGNGGSSADASHFGAEFTGRYKLERKGYPFLTLTTDTSFLTAWSNDYDYSTIFSRQVQTFGQKGDILFLLSTSGKSKNLLEAAKQAKKQGIFVISILGKGGGDLKKLCDLAYVVPSDNTPRIQELHKLIIHIISEEVENKLV